MLAVERRLESSGVSTALFAAHWAFLCDYSALRESKVKKAGNGLKRWMASVSEAEKKGNELGILLSLMLDYLTVVIEHEPERKPRFLEVNPTFDWRRSCASAKAMSEEEVLNYYDVVIESSDESSVASEQGHDELVSESDDDFMVPPSAKRRNTSPSDNEGEGTWKYEVARMVKLNYLQKYHDETTRRQELVRTQQERSKGAWQAISGRQEKYKEPRVE